MQLFQLKHSFVLLVAHNGSKIVAGMNFRTKRIEEVQCHVVPQNCFICLSVIFHLDWMHPGVKNSFSDNPICSAMGQVEQLNLHAVAESRKPWHTERHIILTLKQIHMIQISFHVLTPIHAPAWGQSWLYIFLPPPRVLQLLPVAKMPTAMVMMKIFLSCLQSHLFDCWESWPVQPLGNTKISNSTSWMSSPIFSRATLRSPAVKPSLIILEPLTPCIPTIKPSLI